MVDNDKVKIYDPPIRYSDWWNSAKSHAEEGVEPPIGFVRHGADQTPRFGIGQGEVLAAAYILCDLRPLLGRFVTGAMVHEFQDIRNPEVLLPFQP